MRREMSKLVSIAMAVGLIACIESVAAAAAPTAAQALRLTPIQAEVDYDRPTDQAVEKCTIRAEKDAGINGWVVRDEQGRLLRRFADTNGDNKVDRWCYFKDGVEVYRDADTDFNSRADQCRWLGTAGTRWGLDRDEDGRIDAWKVISAEEVSDEVVAALRDRDTARFRPLVLAPEELDLLGLGEEKKKQLAEKIADTAASFADRVRRGPGIPAGARWIHFGATHPGVVPAGTDGSTRDLTVYENVIAVIDAGGKVGQVYVGTLVRVGSAWRVIDLPTVVTAQPLAAASGFFFQASLVRPAATGVLPTAGFSEDAQKLIGQLESIDKSLAGAAGAKEKADLNARRADVLEQLAASAATGENRATWLRQLVDTVSAAAQQGEYPDGAERLKTLYEKLAKNAADKDLAGYAKFRWMTVDYAQSFQEPKADFAKIQQQWLADLQRFVSDFATIPEAAEAMLQLAIAQEFAGEDAEAEKWYARIIRDFPGTPLAAKAAGARRRLGSVGQALALKGTTTDGKTLDTASYRGKVLLIHYWAAWSEPCKADLVELRRLQAKYAARGFALVGVNLDTDRQALAEYLGANRLPWPQLYESGGFEGRLATELGIFTLPTMILLDRQGRAVNCDIHATALEAELQKELK